MDTKFRNLQMHAITVSRVELAQIWKIVQKLNCDQEHHNKRNIWIKKKEWKKCYTSLKLTKTMKIIKKLNYKVTRLKGSCRRLINYDEKKPVFSWFLDHGNRPTTFAITAFNGSSRTNMKDCTETQLWAGAP